MLGAGGSKLFEKRKEKLYLKQVDELTASMRAFQKEPGNLKEYSPWLSNFRPETLRNELEIPGEAWKSSSITVQEPTTLLVPAQTSGM